MTRRHPTTDTNTSNALRMHSFVFPAHSEGHHGQTHTSMNAVQLSPDQHEQQLLYDQVINHSPVHAHGPWGQQGFPPQAFMIAQNTHDSTSQTHFQSDSQPGQLPSSSSATSLTSGSPTATSTSAAARPRTRSQTKRDAQAARAAAVLHAGMSMLPPPVPPLPVNIAPAPIVPTANGTSSSSSHTSIQIRRGIKTATDATSALPRSTSDPTGLGMQGVKTRLRARKEAEEVKPPPLSVTIAQSAGQLMFAGTVSGGVSPHTTVNSANQSPITFAHPPNPPWAHLSYTPTHSRTMTPTSTTPSLHSSAYSTSSLSPPSLTSATTSSGSSSRRAPKRKAKLTNHLRKEMLEFAEKHPKMTQTDIGIRFEVERSTVSKTLKNRSSILRELEDGRVGPKNRPTKYPDVEEQMSPWVARLTEQNVSISDAMIREKALQIAETLGHTPRFKASVGWVSGFKNRHQIRKGVVGGGTIEDEHMEEEEEPPTMAKRRRTGRSNAKSTGGEVTEEETEREEETSTLANSSQFSSGFSAVSSGSLTIYDPSFEDYATGDSQELAGKLDAQPDLGAEQDMLVEKSAAPVQHLPESRRRAFSNASAPGSSPAHLDGFVSPTGSFGSQAQVQFPQATSEPMSSATSSPLQPLQHNLRADGFLFPALAEEPSLPEQTSTPSNEMSNMVLFTPPQQLPRSSSSRNTLHAFLPSTDTIIEDDEHGSGDASEAAYHAAFGPLGTPFTLSSSSGNHLAGAFQHSVSGFHQLQGELASHSQTTLSMAPPSITRSGVPPMQHAMSELVVSQTNGFPRHHRLHRSHSQSEVLFASRDMISVEHGQQPEMPFHQIAEQFSRPDFVPQGGPSQMGAFPPSQVTTSADPASKIAWLDHTLTQFAGDLSEDELLMFRQVRERMRQQQANDLMAGQNA
ncbi:hypothetical protein DACRYDRAFT_118476 [Dacryopinax primogenitus]|uniref:HTH CENPB-type domain-containing protein n=1 Tax=Dacryopinax primogenitus (strain DJM 731) TaxID=1858805 RepID=M5G4K2_DACPD|nr:uncharacterized protein DACRYDRAFT_118476 [Dacryopinax primogenitus]EJT98667.1 hypothetical protein DACRYDRAFT_118476 [Dacryopinax primogenitus]